MQQGLLALSTTESEYIEMAITIRHLLYLQPTIREVGFPEITSLTVLWGDNQPTISSVSNKPLPTPRFSELRAQLVSDISSIIELGDATTTKLLNIFSA